MRCNVAMKAIENDRAFKTNFQLKETYFLERMDRYMRTFLYYALLRRLVCYTAVSSVVTQRSSPKLFVDWSVCIMTALRTAYKTWTPKM